MSNSFNWHIDRTLSGPTTPVQSEPGSNSNEEVLCIPRSSSITEASPSDCWVLYAGHRGVGSLTSLQRYTWCILQPQPTGSCWGSLTPLQICSWCILQPQATGPQDTRWGSLTPLEIFCWCIIQPTQVKKDRGATNHRKK